MSSELIADSVVSLAAIYGLMVVISTIRLEGDGDALNRRFLFGLQVVTVLLVVRLLFWVSAVPFFDTLTIIAAGAIPFAAIILTEGLLRRHAPGVVKGFVVLGFFGFLIAAFVPDVTAEPWRSGALLLFQMVGFLISGYLVVSRDRESLSPAENQMVERMALSLLLFLPFAITDFRSAEIDFPVRLAGIAILFLCWLSISLDRANSSHRDILRSFLALTTSAIIAGCAIAIVVDLNFTEGFQAVAISLSATMVAAIHNDSRNMRTEERRQSLLEYMAAGDVTDLQSFLHGLQNHISVKGASALGIVDFGDFDTKLLAEIFRDDPVRKVAESREDAPHSLAVREQLSWLFEKYEATHVLLVSEKPLNLVAVNMPVLAGSSSAESELRAVQKMIYLISKKNKA